MSRSDPAHASKSPEVAFAQSPLGEALRKTLSEGSASHRSIADYLLRNAMRATALGVEELAEACQVSTATISRFARDVGFRNFAAMRTAIASTLQAAIQPVDKLRHNIEHRQSALTPARESLEYAQANISATGQSLDDAQMAKLVARLGKARCVYVMGFGLSSHLAGMLALHLQPFCQHVVEVAGPGGTEVAAGHLANITDKDMLIVISFPRYALDVIRLAGFARSRDASIVSITDSPASPLAELGDINLYAQSAHPILPSSASAAVALIEALTVSLMVSNKANVEKAARLTDAIAAYLYGDQTAVHRSTKPTRTKKT